MKKSLYTVYVFSKLNTKRFFRDKLAIFFGILFPLAFLCIFGFINGGDNNLNFNVAVINQSNTAAANQFNKTLADSQILKISPDVTTRDQADERLSRGQLDAIITIPSTFGELSKGQAQLVYSQNSAQAGQAIATFLQSELQPLNSQLVNTQLPYTVQPEASNRQSLSAFDYTFSGLLGFAIIGLGVFGPVNVFPELKKQGILRRLRTTSLKVWQYFLATMVSQAIIGMVSLTIMFVAAIVLFDLKVVGNYFEIAGFLIFSIILILGIGLAIGGWAKNERQAAPLSNLVTFPLLFLSGTFFPRFLWPEWLQNFSDYLPLTPVIDGIRLLTTEGLHLVNILPQLGIMAVWTVLIYALAFKLFRWE